MVGEHRHQFRGLVYLPALDTDGCTERHISLSEGNSRPVAVFDIQLVHERQSLVPPGLRVREHRVVQRNVIAALA